MGFKSLSTSDKKFEVAKQHLINTDDNASEYWILDSKKVTPYLFNCPVCKSSCAEIDDSNAYSFDPKKIKINLESIKELGGTGTMCKIINCEKCATNYFVGIGYIEPNNGRDVLLLHTIIELKEKETEANKDITNRLIQVGKIVKTKVLDHLIISTEDFVNFAQLGLMKKLSRSKKYVADYLLEEKLKKQAETLIRKEEAKKQILKIAKKMKRRGDSDKSISEISGLPIEEVKKIRVRKTKK